MGKCHLKNQNTLLINAPVEASYKRYLYALLIFILFLSLGNCRGNDWELSYREAANRSLLPDVDLILVPELYSNLDDKHSTSTKPATFHKQTIVKQLQKYGKNWKEFQDAHRDHWKEDGDRVQILVQGTTHATNYDYDRQIPIVFFGRPWIEPGIYQDRIFQQHIVPTIAKILGSPVPNGAKLAPVRRILKLPPKFFKKPEIVATIVIDQGGFELFRTHPNSYPNIKKLMEVGAYFPNAEVGHLDAHTGVGHVAIGTGAFPEDHGILANSRVYIQPSIHSEKKYDVRAVFEGTNGEGTPEALQVQTLADVWDSYRKNRPVIISQCYAVRASIGMAGHGVSFPGISDGYPSGDKDFVYWIHKKNLDWITSPNNYQVPANVKHFSLYDYNLVNNQDPWWRKNSTITNGKISREEMSRNFYQTASTPIQAKLEGELFRSVVRSELIQTNLGKDGETDLLYLTLKATDAAGHTYGYESEEARLVLEETDRQVGLIWKMLDEEWKDEYVLVLTADHGAAPLREFSGGMHLSYQDLISAIDTLLPKSVRDQSSLVNFYTSGALSLNHAVRERHSISEFEIVQKILSIQVGDRRFFRKVYRRKDLGKQVP